VSEHTDADGFCIAQVITSAATVALAAALESARAQRMQQPTHHDESPLERAHPDEGLTGSPGPTATLTPSTTSN
jgi:hypothetical protein